MDTVWRMELLSLLAQTTTEVDVDAGGMAAFAILGLVYLAFFVVMLIGYWKVFAKIGLPGWMGIVPFVNVYMIFKARGERDPVLWLILSLIPCVNIVAIWFLANDTAEMFGKEVGWKLFLFFIPGISHIALGMGSAQAVPANIAPGVGINQQFA
jgi:hypothetical protein